MQHRAVDVILLMGPPGSGKSTLGHALNECGLALYTELEAILVREFGTGDDFRAKRQQAHAWIRDFYREAVATATFPVAYETTGISDGPFLEELSSSYTLLYVKVETARALCLERVRTRETGNHVDASPISVAEFYDYWYADIEPTYQFDLTVPGTSTDVATRRIKTYLKRSGTDS